MVFEKNKITFVIPSLNRTSLCSTVESLFLQTNPNWKCIIVYDGVDGKEFKHDRIKTIKINKTGIEGEHNGQSGFVRNRGIELCDTEWIGFIDDDDTIHPNYVDTLFIKYRNYDFVVWRMKYLNGWILPPLDLNELLMGKSGISFCFKKNKIKDPYFYTNRNGEDFDFLFKLKNLTNNWIITPEIYYNVRH